ncbi:Chchd3p [Branchiostoma belcheri]|nr:Chchd3p [Branchiostoma belcheri]
MSRRRGRRRNRRSRGRAVTFPYCPLSDNHADKKGGRQWFLKAAAITVLILVAVTSIAGVVMTAQSLSNTGEDKPAINLPPYESKGDDQLQAGSGDSEGLSPYVYSGWTGVQVKPRDFVENDAEIRNGPADGMASIDAHLTPDAMVPVDMTPPTGHTENARVLDNQTETFRSEGWKRFRVEQNHTEGANSTTEAPTVPPHVVGDEEGEEVAHDWGYTTGENHCNNVRTTQRMTKFLTTRRRLSVLKAGSGSVSSRITRKTSTVPPRPQTVPPHVVGDEEGEEVGHDWGYTTGENHCNNARVRRRVSKVPVGMAPPTGHTESAQVPDNQQTETFRSEGWKRFRVEQNHTEGVDVNSTTEAPTAPPHVVGDEEAEVAHDWGYTTGENHCNNARVPVGMTPPADHAENAQVPDNQTETFRSEGWKRFRVEQNDTKGVDSTFEVPTAIVGDEEGEEVAHDWGYTTGENHCNNVRVRRRVSKVPFSVTDDSSATRAIHLEPKPNCSLDKKVSGDVDSMGTDRTGAMDNVFTKNSTDLNLYLDAVLTDIMKSHKRKHRSGLERIKRSKAIVVLTAVGVLIAGSAGHVYLRQIVPF